MNERKNDKRNQSVLDSFRCAWNGIRYAVTTERNLKLHLVAVAVAAAFAFALNITRWEWALLLTAMSMVMVAEVVNTAIEKAVGLASPIHHPLAKAAKDIAAGAVLLASIFAFLIGLIIYIPHVWIRFVE